MELTPKLHLCYGAGSRAGNLCQNCKGMSLFTTAARTAQEAILSGKSVKELCLLNNMLTQEELDLILNPYEMTHPGIRVQPCYKRK